MRQTESRPERLNEYRELGARFTKWRAVIAIGDGLPTAACLKANAHALALFATLSQEAGLVPIVEPEVLMDGEHTIARCEEVTGATLEGVFHALFDHRVLLEGMLLKTGMTLSFSFGRALQDASLKTWRGSAANAAPAQAALHHRARCNGLAAQGKYSAKTERENPPG